MRGCLFDCAHLELDLENLVSLIDNFFILFNYLLT